MIKQRETNSWKSVSYAKSITGAQTYTKFPIVLRTTDQSIPTWSMDGNVKTSGTPSPSSPITINGVGNKTAQLYNKSDTTTQYNAYLNANGTWVLDNSSRTVKLRCKGNTTYTISIAESSPIFRISEYSDYDLQAGDSSIILSSIIRGENLSQYTFTTSVDSECIIFQGSYSMYDSWLNSLMFVEGSPALPYEPYGYKIPIIDGGVTTNIYLGSTQTTRQIQKLVLTGQESWTKSSTYQGSFYARILTNCKKPDVSADEILMYCTHAEYVNRINVTNYVYGKCGIDGDQSWAELNLNLFIGEASWTYHDFQAYLAQQYANGTPVTVWYVLKTATTAAVNEPLMKIGTYADTLSNAAQIPTTSGLNTIDINTTVKPSEMSLTYDGYKLCKRQRYSRTENLFDGETASGYYNDSGVLVDDSTTSHSTTYIPVDGTTYTASGLWYNPSYMSNFAVYEWDTNKNWLRRSNRQYPPSNREITFTIGTDTAYITLQVQTTHDNIMLNTGSTAKPYQPYLDWE